MSTTVTVRPYRPADRPELERLAVLDSRRVPRGDLLLGEIDGTLLAAVRVDDGNAISDPFAPTADLLAILRLHARHATAAKRGRRRPALHRLRPRPA